MAFRRLGLVAPLLFLIPGCSGDDGMAPSTPTNISWANAAPALAVASAAGLPPGYYKAPDKPAVYLVVSGKAWLVPDPETFNACAQGRWSLVQVTPKIAQLSVAGTIPSAKTYPQIHTGTPLQINGSSDKTVYMVSGCLRAGIPSPTVYQGIYGDQNWGRIIKVSSSVFYSFPPATSVAVAPRIAPGSLIKGSGAEVRWVFGPGMSFGIPNTYVMASHGRSFNEVRTVTTAAFNAYAKAAVIPISCPQFWSTLRTGRGVVQCSGVFVRGNGHSAEIDYAQIVDLRSGARIGMLYSATSAATVSNPSPDFARRSALEWRNSQSVSSRAFCAVNASYFDVLKPWKGIALPLKANGSLVSAGYEATNFYRARLVFSSSGAQVKPYQLNENSYNKVSPYLSEGTVIVGHHRHDNNANTRLDGRQFVAVVDYTGDGVGDVMIVYTSNWASTNDINTTLQNTFRVGSRDYDAIQFDGGGSTQLVCGTGVDGSGSKSYTTKDRKIPVAFGTYEAP